MRNDLRNALTNKEKTVKKALALYYKNNLFFFSFIDSTKRISYCNNKNNLNVKMKVKLYMYEASVVSVEYGLFNN